jgi:hypothetical protein
MRRRLSAPAYLATLTAGYLVFAVSGGMSVRADGSVRWPTLWVGLAALVVTMLTALAYLHPSQREPGPAMGSPARDDRRSGEASGVEPMAPARAAAWAWMASIRSTVVDQGNASARARAADRRTESGTASRASTPAARPAGVQSATAPWSGAAISSRAAPG